MPRLVWAVREYRLLAVTAFVAAVPPFVANALTGLSAADAVPEALGSAVAAPVMWFAVGGRLLDRAERGTPAAPPDAREETRRRTLVRNLLLGLVVLGLALVMAVTLRDGWGPLVTTGGTLMLVAARLRRWERRNGRRLLLEPTYGPFARPGERLFQADRRG